MHLIRNIRNGVSLAAAFILLCSAFALAGDIGGGIIRNIPVSTEELHFKLSHDTAVVVTTTDDDTEAYADLDLLSWWGTPPSTTARIDQMEVQICYDSTKLKFDINGCSINTTNWHGTFAFDSADGTCTGGNRRIVLTLYYEPGYTRIDTVKTSETVYATLRFKPLCQAGGAADTLKLVSLSCTEVLFGDEITYKSLSLEHGLVSVSDNYAASFAADSVYSDCSLLGETVEVPVRMESNFRSHTIEHTLVYDTVHLTFDTVLFNIGQLEWADSIRTNLDTIQLQIGPDSASAFIGEMNDDEIYSLFFVVTDTTNWNGPSSKAFVNFVSSASSVEVNYDDDACTDIEPALSYDGAAVWSDTHWAWFQISADTSDDYLLACEDDYATLVLSMKGSFPSGGAAGGLTIVGNTGTGITYSGLDSDYGDGVSFNSGSYGGTDSVDFYFLQTNTGVLDCNPDTMSELLRFNVQAKTSLPHPASYAQRKLSLPLLASIPTPSYSTEIREAVSGAVYNTTSGVSLISGGPEVPAVEISTTSHTTSAYRVSSNLRLRNNYDLDSIRVTIGATGYMELTCVKSIIAGAIVTDNANGTWTVKIPNGETELYASADSFKTIATLYYEPLSCGGCIQRSGTAAITATDYYYAGTYDDTLFTLNGTVSANCCGTATVNPCENNGGISKTETESADGSLPRQFDLLQNHPNPFNPTTLISYDVPKASHVRIVIYNVLGQEVEELVNRDLAPGRYDVEWDASRLASGVYLYRMEADGFVATKKMLLMK